MPYKNPTPEIKEHLKQKHKEWVERNKEYLKLYRRCNPPNRSDEGKEREKLRLRRNYEKLKQRKEDFKLFQSVIPAYLTV